MKKVNGSSLKKFHLSYFCSCIFLSRPLSYYFPFFNSSFSFIRIISSDKTEHLSSSWNQQREYNKLIQSPSYHQKRHIHIYGWNGAAHTKQTYQQTNLFVKEKSLAKKEICVLFLFTFDFRTVFSHSPLSTLKNTKRTLK